MVINYRCLWIPVTIDESQVCCQPLEPRNEKKESMRKEENAKYKEWDGQGNWACGSLTKRNTIVTWGPSTSLCDRDRHVYGVQRSDWLAPSS